MTRGVVTRVTGLLDAQARLAQAGAPAPAPAATTWCSRANATASSLEWTPSLTRTFCTWVRTVLRERKHYLGDPPVGPAVGQQAQDLPLATGQGPHPQVDAGVAHRPGGRLGRGHDAGLAVDQAADGPGDLPAGRVLGQEAVGPRLQRLGDRLPAGVGREHEHLGAGRGRPDRTKGGGQVGTWHVGVEQQHGRLVPGRQLDRLVAVVGHPEDGQVILGRPASLRGPRRRLDGRPPEPIRSCSSRYGLPRRASVASARFATVL